MGRDEPGWFVAHLLWVVFIFATLIWKLATEGFLVTFKYFTNVVWLIYGLFYAVFLFQKCRRVVIQWCFFLITGLVWFVAGAVTLLFFVEDTFLYHLKTTMALGLLVTGNEIFHFYPTLAWTFFYFFNYRTIVSSLAELYERPHKWLIIFGQIVVAPLVVLGTYLIFLAINGLSVTDVYQADASVPLGVFIFVAFISLVNGGILYALHKTKWMSLSRQRLH